MGEDLYFVEEGFLKKFNLNSPEDIVSISPFQDLFQISAIDQKHEYLIVYNELDKHTFYKLFLFNGGLEKLNHDLP